MWYQPSIRILLSYLFFLTFLPAPWGQVKVWEEPLTLPTYLTKAPDKNPIFFTHQSYQGASRHIYPYKLQDNLTNEKTDHTYKGLYLENEYIKLCVLPEIGGRLFYATDKTNGYELVYRQHVIKPANIGMLGAWISGGIEFCVFHHHRASTNIPVDFRMTQNEDGSATIWIGETEPRHRMKWTLGITLYPGKSYIEVDGRLMNPTARTNSILYWANVATHVNEDYQVVFPPSTDFAVYHAKNSFANWPVTSTVYNGKAHYKNNVDASWWKNHPDPISMFAYDIKEGFVAGYDHGKKAGTMHVGNHHIVKGAKLWEWGPGAYGSMWDSKVLTDNDGPYAEIMTGAYSDNQPDYSWLKPYEYKTFKQYWYPLRETAGASTANLQATIHLQEQSAGTYSIAINATEKFDHAHLEISAQDQIEFSTQLNVAPQNPFRTNVTLSSSLNKEDLTLILKDASGHEVISYQPSPTKVSPPLPDPVVPPQRPEDISSLEELYLTGLRIKQFHNARIDPASYYEEALKRDPLDTRSNTMMGIIAHENFRLQAAADYFRKAIKRTTANYTRPRNCEPLFHLGTILQVQGHLDAAYDTLYRAAWDQDFASPAYFHLAQISVRQKNMKRALIEINRSLEYNANNINAKNIKASILRTLSQKKEALIQVSEVLVKDPLNARALYESILLDEHDDKKFIDLLRDNPESYLELATEYMNAGFAKEAIDILQRALARDVDPLTSYPTIHYYLGYLYDLIGEAKRARNQFLQGSELNTDYCFPFRLESIDVFQKAIELNPSDAHAHYYLGNIFFEKQPTIAMTHWEQATMIKADMARAHRNLGWGYHHAMRDYDKAIGAYEKAIAYDPTDAKFYFELDQLYEKNGAEVKKRYELLSTHHDAVMQRPDAFLQEIKVMLLNQQSKKAIDYLLNHFFPRQEGVDNLHDIYIDACLVEGITQLRSNQNVAAMEFFRLADQYPENHQIGRNSRLERNAQIFYHQALAHEQMGDKSQAEALFQQVAKMDILEPQYKYYQALAHEKMGHHSDVAMLARDIQREAQQLVESKDVVDFFSKFGEGESEKFTQSNAHHLRALAHLLRKENADAMASLQKSIDLNPSNLWARIRLQNM